MLFHLFFHLALPIFVHAHVLSFVSFVVSSIPHAPFFFFFSDNGFSRQILRLNANFITKPGYKKMRNAKCYLCLIKYFFLDS